MRNLVLLSFSAALAACQPQEPPSAFGTLERERVLLTAPATELVLTQSAQEGSKIKAGQVLLQLDTRLQQLKVDKASAEVQRAQAALAGEIGQVQAARPFAVRLCARKGHPHACWKGVRANIAGRCVAPSVK